MIKSWAFEFFFGSPDLMDSETADPAKVIGFFDFHMDLWCRAEELGFDGILMSEHHFGLGFSPSPNLLLPLIAKRTKNLRLGVMGMVVPYHNAWRIAEELRMLDVLCGGRLEVGTSAGIPGEYGRVGLTSEEARARYDEALQIIDMSLRQDTISFAGKYWNFENLLMVPPRIQKPGPPMWTTVISLESARKAARRGSKIATGFVPTAKAKEIFDAYNDEADKVGNPSGPGQLALRRQIIIDSDESAAQERLGQFAGSFRNMLENNDKRVITSNRQALDSPGTHGYTLGDEEFIAGTPAQVAEQVMAQCNECGAGHFQVLFSGSHSPDQIVRGWELYGREVTPVLKKA